ncbi:mitochondrial import inner membrane translocase subunit TIM50-like isoform X4 [Punica granatum]|uniref:Mitochondrial import inner membrane translocase subunit TIM50 n=1 Tax=Punica granatum TaxID=22663 RepID=A0A6P8EAS6_PUNGR|nr:mitochondrial import inner membrane translocase subunit TIM50-like isoform X4 [Punica granatum]
MSCLLQYVDPVVERLDGEQCIRCRLSRSATKYQDGKHYRDHSGHDRNPGKLIYISGHTLELCLQQENCVQIKPWKLEVDDTTLLDLIPFLEFVATRPPRDIGSVLASYEGKYIPKEFIKSSRDYQRNKIIFLLSCLIILDARDTFF